MMVNMVNLHTGNTAKALKFPQYHCTIVSQYRQMPLQRGYDPNTHSTANKFKRLAKDLKRLLRAWLLILQSWERDLEYHPGCKRVIKPGVMSNLYCTHLIACIE